VVITGSQILTNQAERAGGGIWMGQLSGSIGNLSIIGSRIGGNRVLSITDGGAGMYSQGYLTITDSRIDTNSFLLYGTNGPFGGGIYNDNGSLRIDRSTIASNLARKAAGIFHSGYSPIPGGVFSITNSSIISNNAFIEGGGISADGGHPMALENVTVSKNQAELGSAGGIALNNGELRLTNVTVLSNNVSTAPSSLLRTGGGSVFFKNSVVASESSVQLCQALNFQSQGFNRSNRSDCNLNQPTDQQNVDVKLGPLADNGGPTLTNYPLAGSPVIDTGSGCSATDQRGAVRPAGAACDIGAVERGVAPTLTSINPAATNAGAAPFTLSLVGTKFVQGAVAEWNGSARATTWISPTLLLADIPAGDVANGGTTQVRVRNPGPGDGSSGQLPFTVNAQTATPTVTVPPNSTATPTVPPGSTATPTVPAGSTATPTPTATLAPGGAIPSYLPGGFLNHRLDEAPLEERVAPASDGAAASRAG
jgi:hypothetical protein